MLFVCCVLVDVLFIKEYDQMYRVAKGGMARDMRCDVFVLLIYFSVVVVRMDSQMGESFGVKAPPTGQLM